jgi:DAK2 domain fusion protein YloV
MSGSATASGERLVRVVGAARAALEARAGEIDDLNVFPVADGDTGTNMLITAVAVEEAAAATTGLPLPERCAALARAALMGARGNSGMILSQLVRGAAESLAGEEDLGGAALARALRSASDTAYRAVRHPVEGTMLTVARRTAEAAEATADGDRDLAAVLEAALEGGRAGVAETPELLEVLREAGVVDSGGMGVVILLEGLGAGLLGHEVAPPLDVGRPRVAAAADHVPSRYRYCTSFLVEGSAIDLDALEASLLSLGDSLLVMGDAAQAKVHVHTDAPERAAAAAEPWGEVTGLRYDDMRRQEAERDARLRRAARATAACAAVALLPGEGARELAEGLGARALAPEAAAGEVAEALEAGGAPEAVVVVAGPEGLGAALDAAAGRPGVRVIDAGSLPAALASLVGLDPEAAAEGNAAEMRELAQGVRAAGVEGAGAAALRPRLETALAALLGDEPALVTVLVGAGADVSPPEVEAWVRAAAGPQVEVEAHEGGQEAPALAVGVE